jgi:hypothetical protein
MRDWLLSDDFFNESGLPDTFEVDFISGFSLTAFDFSDVNSSGSFLPFATTSLAFVLDFFLAGCSDGAGDCSAPEADS